MATSVGVSYGVASAVATAAVVVTAIAATVLAADVAYSSVTGYSPVKDVVFNGNEEAYNTAVTVTSYATMDMLHAAANNPGVCFVAGTLVLAAEGAKAIEAIVAGDYVWAWDENTEEVSLKQVVETYTNETSELVHISVNGEEIITTPEHPFYSPVKGWTDAIHLRAGDILVLVNGEYVVVEKIQHEILEQPITVYNFQVEDYHTYYVSQTGILVHNSCGGETPATKRGREVHKTWDYGPNVEKEVTIAPGARVDGIDFTNNIVYELKPNNPRAILRGLQQLTRYLSILGEDDWAGVWVLYDP